MTSAHPLDQPVWSALEGRHARLAVARGGARRYDPMVGVFAGVADRSEKSMADLAGLVAELGSVAMLEAEPPPAAPGIHVLGQERCVQMVARGLATSMDPEPDFVELGDGDAAEMLELATLTQPGPFLARTHTLGGFVGVRSGGRLIAMAGERMKPEGFTEVSGVCTHPDHRGRGLAGALMRMVASRILDRGEFPFLHAYAHNEGAIALYLSLGFAQRRDVLVSRLGPTPA